ncbi:MAG: ribonuclease P protein component [Ruegeria sp.]
MNRSSDTAPLSDADPLAPDAPAPPCIRTLRQRPAFLACARSKRVVRAGFVLQGRDRRDGTPDIGIGFTASKKVGNAVMRNRAKRRLRALARRVMPIRGKAGWDYVLIARKAETAGLGFEQLHDDLEHALNRLHGSGKECASAS